MLDFASASVIVVRVSFKSTAFSIYSRRLVAIIVALQPQVAFKLEIMT